MIALLALLLMQDASANPLERVPPQYPPVGAQFGLTAACPTVFDIDASGTPRNICVTCYTSAPAHLPESAREFAASQFATASEEAIARWRYDPADAPASRIETTMEFMLSDDDGTMIDAPEPGPNSNCPQPDIG